MKLGVSTWSLLRLDVASAVRAIGDANFDYVELWGEVPHAYPDWTDKRKLRDILSTYKMTVTMHAPFTDLNPTTSFQPVKGAIERTLDDFVRFSEYLGAQMVTVHPGSVHNEGLIPRSNENSIEMLRSMVKATGGNLMINIENQTKSRSKYHFPLASTTESLELLLAEVEGSRFTLDTGHANVNGQNSLTLAERFNTQLAEIHLSDNAGASDDHMIPGEGTADLQGVLDSLATSDVYLCLELDPHRYTEEQVLSAASQFREKSNAGKVTP